MIIWGLFDSGNGSYKKVADEMGIEIYSIGMDRENKNDHFINLDLADYSYMFGNDKMFDKLDSLPKPDLIIASPPCESWSIASAMKDGNACWKQDTLENLFGTMKGSRFTVRDYKDYEGYQHFPERQVLTRINGELTIYNTIKIINRYNPKTWIIENPAHGRIWDYINDILGFEIEFENLTYYNNYGFDIRKPTRFSSNMNLTLDKTNKKALTNMNHVGGYNTRSNIPHSLIEDIFTKVLERSINNE